MKRRSVHIIVILFLFLAACKKAYQPDIIASGNRYLVVEGVINTAANSVTLIKLSYSTNIVDSIAYDPELNASVIIENESGTSWPLQSQGEGKYISQPLSLSAGQKYRLRILSEGKDYQSDYLTPRNNPEIDSISWERNEDVFTYVNTHDPLNNTRYYRWEYEETYEYHAIFNAIWGLDGRTIVPLDSTNQTWMCWMHNPSTDIILGSTVQLAQDVVNKMPLTTIRKNTEQLYYKYSLLVRQFSLTEQESQFWTILKKNTQQLGTLFDPQPAQIRSNVRCISNPELPVIGYVGACPVREKRLFIERYQVPGWPGSIPNATCEVLIVSANPIDYSIWEHDPPYAPYYFITGGGLAITLSSCVDCRTRGGSNQKPAYW